MCADFYQCLTSSTSQNFDRIMQLDRIFCHILCKYCSFVLFASICQTSEVLLVVHRFCTFISDSTAVHPGVPTGETPQ
jgi:hypothetical protein